MGEMLTKQTSVSQLENSRVVAIKRPPLVERKYAVERIMPDSDAPQLRVGSSDLSSSKGQPRQVADSICEKAESVLQQPFIAARCQKTFRPFAIVVQPAPEEAILVVAGKPMPASSGHDTHTTAESAARILKFDGNLSVSHDFKCPHCTGTSIIKCRACDTFSCRTTSDKDFRCSNCGRVSVAISFQSKFKAEIVGAARPETTPIPAPSAPPQLSVDLTLNQLAKPIVQLELSSSSGAIIVSSGRSICRNS